MKKKNKTYDALNEIDGIKCKNYKSCGEVLPMWWWECKNRYLCTHCDMKGLGFIQSEDENSEESEDNEDSEGNGSWTILTFNNVHSYIEDFCKKYKLKITDKDFNIKLAINRISMINFTGEQQKIIYEELKFHL